MTVEQDRQRLTGGNYDRMLRAYEICRDKDIADIGFGKLRCHAVRADENRRRQLLFVEVGE